MASFHDKAKRQRGYIDRGQLLATGMTDEQIKQVQGNVVHLPTVIGGDVITYNLPAIGATKLKLDGPTIASIYLGEITRWNDSRMTALNPGVKLPATDIIAAEIMNASTFSQ